MSYCYEQMQFITFYIHRTLHSSWAFSLTLMDEQRYPIASMQPNACFSFRKANYKVVINVNEREREREYLSSRDHVTRSRIYILNRSLQFPLSWVFCLFVGFFTEWNQSVNDKPIGSIQGLRGWKIRSLGTVFKSVQCVVYAIKINLDDKKGIQWEGLSPGYDILNWALLITEWYTILF